MHFMTALKTVTQLPDNLIVIITLRLTFDGTPCPFEWGIILETVCDLANELLKYKDWEPLDLHASAQKNIPPRKYLDDDIPFAIGCGLIVDIPIDPQGYADVYIDNTTGLTVNLPGTMNANQLEAAIPLAIKVASQPNDTNEPIPCKKMIAKDKLTVEGGLSETETILGWCFNFRTLTVTLPEHKHIAWSWEIKLMIQVHMTTKRMLESMIGSWAMLAL